MKEEYIAVTNDVYTIQETDEENVFLFYRNDGEELGDVGRAPMDLYQAYVTQMMMNGKIPAEVYARNVYYEKSIDGKYIRLIALVLGAHPEKHEQENKPEPEVKKPGFWKQLLKKIFG